MFSPGSPWFVKLSGLVFKIRVYLGGPVAPDSTMKILLDPGHNAQLLVPETEDIPLKERVRRVNAHCPAVLIENFFMDNKKDLAYLLSQEGRRAIVETIIDGIERCVLTLVSG